MTANPDKAGYLLKEGIVLLRAAYLAKGIDKSIRAIEDELGCVIGKEGHTIRKWKAGEIPLTSAFQDEFLQAAETLVKRMVAWGHPYPDRGWGERFLRSVGHPVPEASFAAVAKVDTSKSNEHIEIQIVMNFSLPRDAFYQEVEKLLWRLRNAVGEAEGREMPTA